MMLVYSTEPSGGLNPAEQEQIRAAHLQVMQDAARQGVLERAEPLASVSSATTVRMQQGEALITDGPFAETKEHLAGYYIVECENLDEAIDWAARIPTRCRGGDGCIEIRPFLSPSRPIAGKDAVDG